MTPAPRLLQVLRLAPEPIKRKLRPLFRQGVLAARALPGANLAARALRRLAPGAHDWLHRRYSAYNDTAALLAQFQAPGAPQLAPSMELGADALLTYGRLRAIATRKQ